MVRYGPVSIEVDLRHAHNVRTSRRDVARVEIGPDRLVHDIAREVIALQLIGAAVGPHLLDRLPRHAVHRWPVARQQPENGDMIFYFTNSPFEQIDPLRENFVAHLCPLPCWSSFADMAPPPSQDNSGCDIFMETCIGAPETSRSCSERWRRSSVRDRNNCMVAGVWPSYMRDRKSK